MCGTHTYRRSYFISEVVPLCTRFKEKQLVASHNRFAFEIPYYRG
jgi:hypothetical protein